MIRYGEFRKLNQPKVGRRHSLCFNVVCRYYEEVWSLHNLHAGFGELNSVSADINRAKSPISLKRADDDKADGQQANRSISYFQLAAETHPPIIFLIACLGSFILGCAILMSSPAYSGRFASVINCTQGFGAIMLIVIGIIGSPWMLIYTLSAMFP